MDNNYCRVCSYLLYPFIVLYIMIISRIDCSMLFLKMTFPEFATPWFAIWSVLGAGVGLYQFQKNMEMSKEHNEDIINTQKEIIDIRQQMVNIEHERYYSRYERCMQMLNSNSEIIRLQAIDSMCVLASENKEYVVSVCNALCNILSTTKIVTKIEKQRVITCLFDQYSFVFENVEKNINNGSLDGLRFVKVNIKNAHFNNTTLINCKFHNSDIQESIFIYAEFRHVLFRTTTIKHTLITNAVMHCETRISRSELHDVNFTQSELKDIQIADVIFNKCEFLKSNILDVCGQKIKFHICGFDCNNICGLKLMFSNEQYLKIFVDMLPDNLDAIFILKIKL